MNKIHSLNDIKPGQKATVKELVSTGSIRRRLLDIGLVENRRRNIGAKIYLQASLTRLPVPIFPSSELLQNIIRKRSL